MNEGLFSSLVRNFKMTILLTKYFKYQPTKLSLLCCSLYFCLFLRSKVFLHTVPPKSPVTVPPWEVVLAPFTLVLGDEEFS